MKILKWAGIATLVALPFFLYLKRCKMQQENSVDDDRNIYTVEFEEWVKPCWSSFQNLFKFLPRVLKPNRVLKIFFA